MKLTHREGQNQKNFKETDMEPKDLVAAVALPLDRCWLNDLRP
jgi:hypothetical protein